MSISSTLPGNGSGTVNNTAERAHQAIDRVTESAAPAIGRAVDAAHRTVDKAASAAAPAAQWMTDNSRQLANRSSEMAEVASTYVRAHPITTVAGALVLGWFFAKLLR